MLQVGCRERQIQAASHSIFVIEDSTSIRCLICQKNSVHFKIVTKAQAIGFNIVNDVFFT